MSKLNQIVIALTGDMPATGENLQGAEFKLFTLQNLDDGRQIIFQPNAQRHGLVPLLSVTESSDGQVTLAIEGESWTFAGQEHLAPEVHAAMMAAALNISRGADYTMQHYARHLVAASRSPTGRP